MYTGPPCFSLTVQIKARPDRPIVSSTMICDSCLLWWLRGAYLIIIHKTHRLLLWLVEMVWRWWWWCLIQKWTTYFGLFQTAQQLLPKRVGQVWAKKNGSLAAPQSANSGKVASGLRNFSPFSFLQSNFTCSSEVQDLKHEMKRRLFSRRWPVLQTPLVRLPEKIFKYSGTIAFRPRKVGVMKRRWRCWWQLLWGYDHNNNSKWRGWWWKKKIVIIMTARFVRDLSSKRSSRSMFYGFPEVENRIWQSETLWSKKRQ